MSPEQILNPERPSTAWDVWALATLAFSALAGSAPHGGTTLASILVSTMNGSRPAVASLRDDVGPETDAVFDRAFAASPVERFETPRAFADALEASLAARVTARARRAPRSAHSLLLELCPTRPS